MIRSSVAVLSLLCFLSSCGYQLGPVNNAHKLGINNTGGVKVVLDRNLTLNKTLEPLIIRSVQNALAHHGVKTSQGGDYELKVSLDEVDYRALRSSDRQVLAASEFETRAQTSWVLLRQGKQVLGGKETGSATFFSALAREGSDFTTLRNVNFVQASRLSYPQAIQEAAQSIASKIAQGF